MTWILVGIGVVLCIGAFFCGISSIFVDEAKKRKTTMTVVACVLALLSGMSFGAASSSVGYYYGDYTITAANGKTYDGIKKFKYEPESDLVIFEYDNQIIYCYGQCVIEEN